MLFLRQSTASQEVLFGPFVSDTDGKTPQTGLTIANTDIKLWVEGATTEASKNSGGATHIAAGRFYTVLDATDTATVGKMELNVHVAGALPVRREFHVLEEAVYDSLFAASAAGYQVPIWAASNSTVNLSGTTIATTQKVDVETIKTNPVVNAGTVTFPTGATLASTTNITGGTITTVTNLTNAPTAGDLTATMKTSVNTEVAAALATYDGPTNAEMVARTIAAADYATAAELAKVPKSDGTATWNATALASINAEADTALSDYDAPTNAEMVARTLAAADYATATNLATVDTVVDAIKAKTDLLTTFPANFSSLSIDSTGFVGANVTNSGTAAAGSSSSITLSASASTTNNYYVRQYVQIVSGTGAGQVRQVAGYTGSSKLVSVNFAWTTAPDNTSVYRIIAAHVPHVSDNAGVTRAKDDSDASLATATNLNTVDDFLDTEVAAILAAVDTEVAAIKTKTDQLTFTVANQVDSNALSGGGSGLDAAGVRAAVGLASANLDTQLGAIDDFLDTEVAAIKAKTDNLPASPAATGDIPSAATNATAVRSELTTELGRIDAAVSTRATPAQVATELATYDSPTNAEMVARTLAAADYATATNLAAVKTDTGNLVTRITSTLFSGITSMAQWLGLLAGKQVGDTTARTELRATGAGSGTFDETTDSMQAVRDRGDAAWGGEATVGQEAIDAIVAGVAAIAGSDPAAVPAANATFVAKIDYIVAELAGRRLAERDTGDPTTGTEELYNFANQLLRTKTLTKDDSPLTFETSKATT